jgi:hypothetical protein
MKLLLPLIAILGSLAAIAPASAAGAPDFTKFTAACEANKDYLEAAGAYFDGAAKGVIEYCGCIVEGIGTDLSQSDVDMLTADLNGKNTDEKRMAYETYEDLTAFYTPIANDCLVISGLADGYDPGAEGEEGGDGEDSLAD